MRRGSGGKETVPALKSFTLKAATLQDQQRHRHRLTASRHCRQHDKEAEEEAEARDEEPERSRRKAEDDEQEKHDEPRVTFGFGREHDCSINEIGWSRAGGGGGTVSLTSRRGRGGRVQR